MPKKLALVTGGTRGIGAAIAKKLKSDGYEVVVSYIGHNEPAKIFTNETGIRNIKFDVSYFEDCRKAVGTIEKEYNQTIDILVNNAGITKDKFLHKMSVEEWNAVININLNSMFNVTRNVIESMRSKGFGRIVSISSINGVKGQMGQSNYSASKAGIIGFTKAVAQENANKGITVNAVAPGYVGTDMVKKIDSKILDNIVAQIPVGRLAEPNEIASIVSYLCSDDAGFITGSTFNINGGQYYQ